MSPDQLKAWRKALGLTQREAADALGLSRSAITNYEAGFRRDTGEPVLIPRVVALACAALKAGLEPEGG